MREMSDEFHQVRRNAFATCALGEAADPGAARNMGLYLFGKHTPITRDDVAQRLGEDVAVAWEAVRAAIAEFKRIAE